MIETKAIIELLSNSFASGGLNSVVVARAC
jgi:hypothetical protein